MNFWLQVGYLGVAFGLTTLIGLERQLDRKPAGMRTHALVGMGSALFMLISKFGFNDILNGTTIRLDPSRLAAQVVTGIGFIGAGLIVMRRGAVQGLTTAASIWITCAIGMACGAGMLHLAIAVTVAYFVAVQLFPWLTNHAPILRQRARYSITVMYRDGTGALRDILATLTDSGYTVQSFTVEPARPTGLLAKEDTHSDLVQVDLLVTGPAGARPLVAQLSGLDHVRAVSTDSLHD